MGQRFTRITHENRRKIDTYRPPIDTNRPPTQQMRLSHPQWKVRRHRMSLRYPVFCRSSTSRASSKLALSIHSCSYPIVRLKPASTARKAQAAQRSTIAPSRQLLTRRLLARMVEWPESIRFVVPRQRLSLLGN